MEEYLSQMRGHIAACLLATLQQSPEIIMSWGFENPRPILEGESGIQFHTCGYKHTGFVAVRYHRETETYSIELVKEDGTPVSTTENIKLAELTETIDNLVERTEDYEKRISDDYPILAELAKREEPIQVVIL